ncbi:response regulator [Phenylobacterium sp.]|uniref:response regulator n=1 Tax=Phenylobacterium sp. TaxID=1871053 RepID=UPI0027370F13|nr:response regulator [Phenylobacterium sp.]MDP3855753.1 response regulator [Phenylobacterium sp.]
MTPIDSLMLATHDAVRAASQAWFAGGTGKTPSPAPGAFQPLPGTQALRVLIVEDEAIVAMSLESLIEDFGFEVCAIASTGEQAVALAASLRPDLILMDVNLIGDMDGVEAARRARKVVDARIVFVTAYGGEMLERIRATVPDSLVVAKPVMGPALLEAIERTRPQ